MNKPIENVSLSVGANPIHRFPKNYNHTTTGTFMQFNLATVMEIPKSSLKCKHKSFLRSFPLKRPLLANINIHKQAYFVPYRTIWEPWSDFKTDTPHNQPNGTGIISNTPLIKLSDLIELFATNANYRTNGTNVVPSDLEHGCDFVWTDSQAVDWYFDFTPFGRWAYKLFCSMGLRIPFASYSLLSKEDTVDALPFLAVAKVYIDYFFPNQYAHYGVYASIDGIFQRQVTYILSQSEIDLILQAIYKVSYGSDYFVSAFDSPLMSASGVQSMDFVISDVSLPGTSSSNRSQVEQNVDGTPVERRADGQSSYVASHTQYMADMLKSLTNYIRRHSLAGSRALTRYLSDWGVVLTADKLKRCYKLGETVFPLQVGDVTSQSDTYNEQTGEGAQLGDYAGRSVAYNSDFDFDIDSDEFGLLVVTYSIVPTVSYVQGTQRYWFHKTKLDFLTGDFDGMAVREIRQVELFCGTKRPVSPSSLFGFIPAYAEDKVDYDVMSGDFAVDTKNLGLMGFESARMFSDAIGDNTFNVAHGLDFVLGNDSQQYNRIFFEDVGLADKFVMVHRAEFEHNIPAVPLWDNYDFADGKKKIKLEVNGSKDN